MHHVVTSVQRKKSTLHAEIVYQGRPKLNSITIGFSMHAHNFPISGIDGAGVSGHKFGKPHKKHSIDKKRKKLHSMKPPNFEVLDEKISASVHESHSQKGN